MESGSLWLILNRVGAVAINIEGLSLGSCTTSINSVPVLRRAGSRQGLNERDAVANLRTYDAFPVALILRRSITACIRRESKAIAR